MDIEAYDHATKAGNQGDVAKHPALVAALNALLIEHEGVFHYADTFAGRWENDLSKSDAWKQGIKKFADAWDGGNFDVNFWLNQWTAGSANHYPGSTQLAAKILSKQGHYEIRAFEIVEEYAVGLRRGLGDRAVVSRPATENDWADWKPNLLFIDPPGFTSKKKPDFPSLGAMLESTSKVENVLIWLPMITDPTKGGPVLPINANTVSAWRECLQRGFQVLAVRWQNGGPVSGCLLAYRFESTRVSKRVGTAVRDVVVTMGKGWRVV